MLLLNLRARNLLSDVDSVMDLCLSTKTACFTVTFTGVMAIGFLRLADLTQTWRKQNSIMWVKAYVVSTGMPQ